MSLELAITLGIVFAAVGYFLGRNLWPRGMHVGILILSSTIILLLLNIFVFRVNFLSPFSVWGGINFGILATIVILLIALYVVVNPKLNYSMKRFYRNNKWFAWIIIGVIILLLSFLYLGAYAIFTNVFFIAILGLVSAIGIMYYFGTRVTWTQKNRFWGIIIGLFILSIILLFLYTSSYTFLFDRAFVTILSTLVAIAIVNEISDKARWSPLAKFSTLIGLVILGVLFYFGLDWFGAYITSPYFAIIVGAIIFLALSYLVYLKLPTKDASGKTITANLKKRRLLLYSSAGIIALILIFLYFSQFGTASAILTEVLSGGRYILALILALVAIPLLFVPKKKDKWYGQFWWVGFILLALAAGFIWLGPSLLLLNTAGLGNVSILYWVFYIILAVSALAALVKGRIGLFFVFAILGVAFWFAVPFITSEIVQKYSVRGEIELEESGFIPRLSRFWYYVTKPEEYFASYGEFTNPNAKQKGPDKGLKIISFEPIVTTFRADQNIRLLAEVKNFKIPLFTQEEVFGELDKGELDVNLGFGCKAFVNNKSKEGELSIANSCGKIEEDTKVVGVDRNKDCTFFITCEFKDLSFFKEESKNEETKTFKATLSVNYENFVTQSVLKTYVMGKEEYDSLIRRENGELELLNELRSSASVPGLIDNDRKVTSEYTGGPIELATNIINSQPLTPDSDQDYTLFVNTRPLIDWEGKVTPEAMSVIVPDWFTLDSEDCQFDDSSVSGGIRSLRLKEEEKGLLESGYRVEGSKPPRGARFICDFTVSSRDRGNIEEYNIKAFQQSDYFLNKSTTFDVINLGNRLVKRDSDEETEEAIKETTTTGEELKQCDDGKDNDGDGLVDDKDPGCYDEFMGYRAGDNDEIDTLPHCSDYFDNDGHDGADAADKDCHSDSDVNNNDSYTPELNNGEGVTITG